MKGIIVYKSKTGFTQRYAQWLQEETQFDLKRLEDLSPAALSGYETVIFGGRLHAGRVDGLKKLLGLVRGQRLLIFATGASPAEATALTEGMWAENLTPEQLQAIPHFYLQAGLNYERMGLADRLMMKVFASMMRKKKDKTPEDMEMAKAISQSYDLSSKEHIAPLLECLRANGSL